MRVLLRLEKRRNLWAMASKFSPISRATDLGGNRGGDPLCGPSATDCGETVEVIHFWERFVSDTGAWGGQYHPEIILPGWSTTCTCVFSTSKHQPPSANQTKQTKPNQTNQTNQTNHHNNNKSHRPRTWHQRPGQPVRVQRWNLFFLCVRELRAVCLALDPSWWRLSLLGRNRRRCRS